MTISERKIINGRYMPIEILKSDIRGDVIKAVRIKGIRINWCILKQSKIVENTDIPLRYDWQEKINIELRKKIPMQRLLERFDSNGHLYLVFTYLKGINLKDFAIIALANKPWYQMSEKKKKNTLAYISLVATCIQNLHDVGYVHRDITPTNFIVKRKRIMLIDFESMYSLSESYPSPPFGYGTTGYMSPSQQERKTPTFKDDIYSIGGLLILLLTGIEPLALVETNRIKLKEKLLFFIRDNSLVNLILDCINLDTSKRPELLSIQKISLDKQKASHHLLVDNLSKNAIDEMIEKGIEMILGPDMRENSLWFTDPRNLENISKSALHHAARPLLPWMGQGVGGVLWLLNAARNAGYTRSSTFINNILFTNLADSVPIYMSGGLYEGRAGLSLLGIEIPLHIDAKSLGVSNGLAGHGLALLGSKQDGNKSSKTIADILIKKQQKNGGWNTTLGFGFGEAGIIYFLLEYGRRYKENSALEAAKKGVNHLLGMRQKLYPDFSWLTGDGGLAFLYLNAFEFWKLNIYKLRAIQLLEKYPDKIACCDITQYSGLSGLGEVYLEAFRITGNNCWLKRAYWLCQLFANLMRTESKGTVYWLTKYPDYPTADVMMGMGGVIHFLIHYLNPFDMKPPFLPSINKS